MKNSDPNELSDKAMAGRLTAEERAQWEALLARDPGLELDAELGRALQSLPAPPLVASNFTARVLQEINKQESGTRVPAPGWLQRLPPLLRFAAAAAAVVAVSVTMVQRQQQQAVTETVTTFADGLKAVAARPVVDAAAKPEVIVDVLQDFEAIRRLPASAPEVDSGLLAALGSEL